MNIFAVPFPTDYVNIFYVHEILLFRDLFEITDFMFDRSIKNRLVKWTSIWKVSLLYTVRVTESFHTYVLWCSSECSPSQYTLFIKCMH